MNRISSDSCFNISNRFSGNLELCFRRKIPNNLFLLVLNSLNPLPHKDLSKRNNIVHFNSAIWLFLYSVILLMIKNRPAFYSLRIFSDEPPMKLINFNHRATTLLSSLVLFSLSLSAIRPAHAGFLDGITDAIRGVNNAVDGVKDTHRSLTGTVDNLSGLGTSLGLLPGAPSNDIFDIYGSWYGALSPSEKEVVKALVTEFAEDKQLSFAEFKKSPEYGSLSSQAKSAANAIFFKFKGVSTAATPVKDKFLAFAFCLSGGSTKCK
jgi:hypothetical protein